MMKTRPILFSSEMVRALLEGRKTQTRRIFKQATGLSLSVDCDEQGIAELSWLHGAGPGYPVEESIKHIACPYGQVGDLLWVKETINRGYCGDTGLSRYAADGFPTKADAWPWLRDVLSSIHCPMGLSRLTLRITSVRVERLHEISQKDATAEGVSMTPFGCHKHLYPEKCLNAIDGYHLLWDEINGAGAWDKNPWVWVVEFEVIHMNVLELLREAA